MAKFAKSEQDLKLHCTANSPLGIHVLACSEQFFLENQKNKASKE